jgi:hypothetical protein
LPVFGTSTFVEDSLQIGLYEEKRDENHLSEELHMDIAGMRLQFKKTSA